MTPPLPHTLHLTYRVFPYAAFGLEWRLLDLASPLTSAYTVPGQHGEPETSHSRFLSLPVARARSQSAHTAKRSRTMELFPGTRPLLFLSVLTHGFLLTLQTKEEVLLDMRATGGELGWLTWPLDQGDKPGWEVVQRTLNGSQFYTYSVCNVGEREQDNWLRTTFIQRRPSASRVFVELQFIVRDCNSFDGASLTCKETFNLFASEADADVGTTFRKGQFKKVATIAPDEITSKNDLRINTETKVVENLSRKGFYLAFQDIGACVALLSVRVYYKTCPATLKSLASFRETVAGGENQALREVIGECVENAVSEEQPRIYCTTDGEWVVPVGQCQCKPGYEEVGNACKGLRDHHSPGCGQHCGTAEVFIAI
uniref:receptor protein-tyrosine kinase n=1 Tax=Knipowitschia caucasica TaxID=637954 RepID=A0AAV2LW96_KNICA